MIEDNYLTIRKWVPNFIPDEAPIKVLTAWVRIPNLSVEYFDGNFLHKIGSKIGKVLRIDKTTANAERGQFTRLSVEIDLTKPLLSKFWLKGRVWKVQYEGLQLICFNCGCWGHSVQDCNASVNAEVRMEQEDPPQNISELDPPIKERPELAENFGDWMLVRKPTRKRPPRLEVKDGSGGRNAVSIQPPPPSPAKTDGAVIQNLKPNSPRAKSRQVSEIQGEGSRFSILENDISGLPILEEAAVDVREKSSHPTPNLAESSQIPSISKEPLEISFKIGKDKNPNQKKINVSPKPTNLSVKQNLKLKPLRKQILRAKDSNVPIQERSKFFNKSVLGKENANSSHQAITRASVERRNHVESTSMPPPAIHLPSFPASPPCHQPSHSPREDPVCGKGDG